MIQNGIKLVFTVNTDAFIGTNMNSVGQTLGASYKNQLIEVKPNTKYTISLSSAPKCYISQYNEELTSVMFERIPANNNKTQYTITTNSNARYIGLRLGILDSSLTNYNFTNIQIEEGEVATDYEEYGVSPSLNYPSPIYCLGDDVNLINCNNNATHGGVTIKTSNRKIIISGQATTEGAFTIFTGTLKKGSYHIKAFATPGAGVYTVLRVRVAGNVIKTGLDCVFTLTEATQVIIDIYFNAQFKGTYTYTPKLANKAFDKWSPFRVWYSRNNIKKWYKYKF